VSTAILITARLKSTRLPRKVMRPIHGRPMIAHMVERLRLARGPERIILCTSPVAQDDPLAEFAAAEGIACFRGDPDDVLQRLTDAAQRYGVDTVVNCTADNPFVDPVYLDRLVDFLHAYDYDYADTDGLAWGLFGWAMTREAMLRACRIKAERDTEVWGPYFTETGLFSWGTLVVDDPRIRWPDLRLTVDTPEDFELVTRIFDELYVPGEVFPLEAIMDLCRTRPDLVAINAAVRQKKPIPIRVNVG